MNAGESARREAQRSRERAERLSRRAELFEQGAQGESLTATALESLGPEWVLLHDHRWPGRRLANIDHIAIGPGGIFVIDSKNWSGRVEVRGPLLRQNGRSREKAVSSAADAGLAIADLVPTHAHLVRSVLCFTQQEALSGWVRDVMVCSQSNIVRMLTSRPRLLPGKQVRDLALRLDVELRSAVPEQQEARSVRSRPSGPTGLARTSGRRGPKAGKSPSATRLLVVLAAALLFMVSIPTVLPVAAKTFSDFFIQQVVTEDDKCGPTKRGQRARGEQAQRRTEAVDGRCK